MVVVPTSQAQPFPRANDVVRAEAQPSLCQRIIDFVKRIFAYIVELFSYSDACALTHFPEQPLFPAPPQSAPAMTPSIQSIVREVPKFNSYRIMPKTELPSCSLTSVTIRPANLLHQALFGERSTTMPSSGNLFRYLRPLKGLRAHIDRCVKITPNKTISVSAQGIRGSYYALNGNRIELDDLARLFGDGVYQFTWSEIQSILQSQQIYVAPRLPLQFYSALKEAMLKDGVVELPYESVRAMQSRHCKELIQRVLNADPSDYGFQTVCHRDEILGLTLYHLGSLVVKRENFHIMINENGQIIPRQPGTKDAVRLINACGLRDCGRASTMSDEQVVREMFHTMLCAAEKDFLVVPAIGMGVWGGPPEVYWPAFFDAVAQCGDQFETIFVNPAHQPNRGMAGEEFQRFLRESRQKHGANPQALRNLGKIVDLFSMRTDVVQLARLLKEKNPEKIVSLLNASDPDVTLGNHVGEYVNNLGHGSTTEENYAALGTSTLNLEVMTGVHKDPKRLIQVAAVGVGF